MSRPAGLLPTLLLALFVAACAGTDGADGSPADAAAGGDAAQVTSWRGAAAAPAQLVGLDAAQLDRLLGPADFKRSDGPAEIRQYRDAGCVLDVFLYADAATGEYRVAHVAARDRTHTGEPEQACVSSLLQARRLRSAG